MSTKIGSDYTQLNSEEIKKYFEDLKIDFTPNKKITEKQFNENLPKLLKPNINLKENSFSSEEKYIPKVSDPYKHLLKIKSKLIQNKNDIDKAISNYNDISAKVDLNDVNNYSLLFSNLHKYKGKIDNFVNYDIIERNMNKKESESESDSEESDNDENKDEQKNQENKLKHEENKQKILKNREENEKLLKQIEESTETIFRKKKELNSLNDKYKDLSNNLISKINSIDDELNTYMGYRINAPGGVQTRQLKLKIIDLEKQVSQIESIIGDFNFMKYKNTIFGTLKHFLKFNLETNANKEWISSRYENVKIFENLMQSFNSESENETLLNLYKQLCDAYMIYLIMEKFKDVISYLKKRIIAIKNIVLNSEQFEFDIKELNNLIKENEGKYEILKFKYLQALESFGKLENILKEINNLDELIKKKI